MKQTSTLFVMAAVLTMLAAMPKASAQDITIGGTSAYLSELPTDCNYQNSVASFIYTADEIGGPCYINSISFRHSEVPDLGYSGAPLQRSFKVYFSLTDQSDFSSEITWFEGTPTLVFSSGVTVPSGNTPMTLTLDEPFFYDGTGNLLVFIRDINTNYDDWHYFLGDDIGTAPRTIYAHSNTDNFSVLPLSPNTTSRRPQIILGTSSAAPDWNWGDEMSYCGDGDFIAGAFTSYNNLDNVWWGNMYPAQYMGGRNYANYASFYCNTSGNYTLRLYQSNNDIPSGSPIYEGSYNISTTGQWVDLPVNGIVSLDTAKNLWVFINCDQTFAASYTSFCGDTNGGWYTTDNRETVQTDRESTWMLNFTTSATPPDLPQNDTVTLPYSEGFEEDVDGWTIVDADADGKEWAFFDNESWPYSGYLELIPHSGDKVASSASYDYRALTPDNWLISLPIALDRANITLTWWDYAYDNSDYAEHYSVLLSTTGMQTADFTVNLFETTIDAPRTWQQRTVDLSAYSGQTVRIAFRHYDCTDQNALFIDDIEIDGTGDADIATAEAQDVTLAPNPTTGLVHIECAQTVQRVEVCDLMGRKVCTAQSADLDLSALPAGIYLLRIATDDGIAIRRVVRK